VHWFFNNTAIYFEFNVSQTGSVALKIQILFHQTYFFLRMKAKFSE